MKVEQNQLFSEVMSHKPIARQHMVQTGCSTFDAWKAAIQKTRSRSSTKARRPWDALHKLLLAFGVMGGSSSSVEHAFSKVMKNISPQSWGSVASEQILTKIILERDAYAGQEDELIAEARRVWSDNYGAHRQRIGDAQRIDAGIPRPESAGKRAAGTEIGWLRNRRRGVRAAVPNKSEAVVDLETESDADGHNELNTQQRAEMKFMRDKLARKKSLAFNAGSP